MKIISKKANFISYYKCCNYALLINGTNENNIGKKSNITNYMNNRIISSMQSTMDAVSSTIIWQIIAIGNKMYNGYFIILNSYFCRFLLTGRHFLSPLILQLCKKKNI